MKTRLVIILAFILATAHVGVAQFSTVQRMDASSRFFNKDSNKPMSFRDFQKLNQEFPNQYVPIAVYDKYGKVDYYLVRKKTRDEMEMGQISMFEGVEEPVVGQQVAPFVMEGADGKTYDSDQLRGSYILISFWLKLQKKYLGPHTTDDLVVLQNKVHSKGVQLISLGVSYSTKDECKEAMKELNLGFIPIPDSRSFTIRYSSPNSPSFLLIGPDGKVVARSEGVSPLGLERYFNK